MIKYEAKIYNNIFLAWIFLNQVKRLNIAKDFVITTSFATMVFSKMDNKFR